MKKHFSKTQLMGMLLIIFGFGLFLDMILGHFEPGGLILHLLCLCLEGIIVKRIVMYGEMYFYLLVVSYFYFSYFHQQHLFLSYLLV